MKKWRNREMLNWNSIHYYPFLQTNQQIYYNQPPIPAYPYLYKHPYIIQNTPVHNPYIGPDIKYEGSDFAVQNKHIHVFTGVSTLKNDHKHPYNGVTEPAENNPRHTHLYWTVTQYEDEHRHILKGETGPAIPLPSGGHTHELKGRTYGYPSHHHYYSEYTNILE